MTTARVFAPAKINLTLHVTGQRPDGYHLLDSLVVFGDIGDWISVSLSQDPGLTITGPMARGVPTDRGNLVLRAAELMGITANIQLEKHLPSAAGLGGGSSDAAATLRALAQLTGQPLPGADALLHLGADVALCLSDGLTRMRGIGEQLHRLGKAPDLSLILVNPGVSVATSTVFHELESKTRGPMTPLPPSMSGPDWNAWLAAQRNDLQASAMGLEPVIGRVLQALRQCSGCLLARMSGSGATCFAIMRDDATRDQGAEDLTLAFPDWWVKTCTVNHSAAT